MRPDPGFWLKYTEIRHKASDNQVATWPTDHPLRVILLTHKHGNDYALASRIRQLNCVRNVDGLVRHAARMPLTAILAQIGGTEPLEIVSAGSEEDLTDALSSQLLYSERTAGTTVLLEPRDLVTLGRKVFRECK
jgi:hypothetical protein